MVMSGLQLLQSVAVCYTRRHLPINQAVVLLTVARFPGLTCGKIANVVGFTRQNASKVTGYLRDAGEMQMVEREGRKLWFLTAGGVKQVQEMLKQLRWSERGRFGVVELPEERQNLWRL